MANNDIRNQRSDELGVYLFIYTGSSMGQKVSGGYVSFETKKVNKQVGASARDEMNSIKSNRSGVRQMSEQQKHMGWR